MIIIIQQNDYLEDETAGAYLVTEFYDLKEEFLEVSHV